MQKTSNTSNAVQRGWRAGLAAALGWLVVAVGLLPGIAMATTGSWSAVSWADWNNASNWKGGVIPNGAGDVALFTNTLAQNAYAVIREREEIGEIYFNSIVKGRGIVVLGPLLFNNNGMGAWVRQEAGTLAGLTIWGDLVLADNLTVVNNSLTNGIAMISLGSTISETNGSRSLTKDGVGVVSLFTGTNTYTGGTFVNAGTLVLGITNAHAGSITVAAGAGLGLGIGPSGSNFYSKADVDNLWVNGTLSGGGVTMAGNSLVGIDTSVTNFTYDSNLSGVRGLIKTGGNALTLTGTNSYSGVTTVQGGALVLATTNAQSANSAITVLGGSSLGLGVGGAGGYTEEQVNQLWTNGMAGVTLSDEATIGIDTSAGDFTYSTGHTNRNIAKLGSNTLTIAGNNTFSSSLSVHEGSLKFSGSTNTFSGQGISVGSGSQLIFNNGCSITSSAIGFSAKDSSILLSGTVWNNTTNIGLHLVDSVFTVADGSIFNGSSNLLVHHASTGAGTLVVSNSGVINVSGSMQVGDWFSSAPTGAVLITGSGSAINVSGSCIFGNGNSPGSLVVSNSGSLVVGSTFDVGVYRSSRVLVTAGGQLFSSNSTLGFGYLAPNDNNSNSVLLTGTGSVWSNSGSLVVGNSVGSIGNSLTISNGGVVTVGTSLTVGQNAGANGNTLTVDGSGSTLTASGDIYAGVSGSSNTINITGGGVMKGATVYVGGASGATHNKLLITGSGSAMTNTTTWLGFASSSSFNTLVVSNGGRLRTAGELTSDKGTGGNSNAMVFTGVGTVVDVLGSPGWGLSVGGSGSGNTLVLDDHAVVNNRGYPSFFMGNSSTSSNNTALITGSAIMTNVGNAMVGKGGHHNTLVVSNGGFMYNGYGFAIGNTANANSNSVRIYGATIQTVGQPMTIGSAAGNSGNSLTIGSGALASASLTTVHANNSLTNDGTLMGGLVISNGAFATGGGHYNGAVTNIGTLTPGVGGDTNYFSSLTLMGGSTNTFWIGNAAHDMSEVTNLVYGTGGAPVLNLDFSNGGYVWAPSGTVYTLYKDPSNGWNWDGTNQLFRLAWNGQLWSNGATMSGINGNGNANFKIIYGSDAISIETIPEPSTAGLLLGLTGVAYVVRRYRGWKKC